MKNASIEVVKSVRSVRRLRARALGGVATVAITLGLGCAAPVDAPAERVDTGGEALTVHDLAQALGDSMTFASAANMVLSWYGINLGGSTGPSNQDILNQINSLSTQISLVDQKVNVLLQDARILQISLQTISNQVLQTSMDAKLADMDGAMAGMQTYMFEIANGQPPNPTVPALLSDQTATDVAFFKLPDYYQQLNATGGTEWTPIFALAPFVKAVSIRAVFLGSFFPTNFRQIPGVVAELRDDANFATSLATNTAAWGRAHCTVTTKYVCVKGHNEIEIINNKPHKFFVCDQENDSYTATCAGTGTTHTGFPSEAAASAAGYARLPSLFPAMDTFLGVDALRALSANLNTLAGGTGSTIIHAPPAVSKSE